MIALFGDQLMQFLFSSRQASRYATAVRLDLDGAGETPSLPQLFNRVEMNFEQLRNFDLCQFAGLAGMHNPASQI